MKVKQIIPYILFSLCLLATCILFASVLNLKKNQNKKIDTLNSKVQALEDDNSKLHKELDEANNKEKILSENIEKQSKDITTLNEKAESLKNGEEALGDVINDLYNRIYYLEEEMSKNDIEYLDEGYNYLAIGNSITKHGLADYWWSESGMAATRAENDYVHLVASYLNDVNEEVCYYAVNYSVWERADNDRADTYEVIKPYLSTKLDLVTIQLSENVTNTTTFESDFEALINYIKYSAPSAKIMVIGDFWDISTKDSMKLEAANNTNVEFISLNEIKNDPDYQCGMGTIVFDEEGNSHVVEHADVAKHPGDNGMQYIANAIIVHL